MARNNRNTAGLKTMSNTINLTGPLSRLQHYRRYYSVLMLSYHHTTQHSSLTVRVYFLALQSSSPRDHLQSRLSPADTRDTRIHSHHSLTPSDRSLFQEFSTKQDIEEDWAQAPRCTPCWISRDHHQQQAVVFRELKD